MLQNQTCFGAKHEARMINLCSSRIIFFYEVELFRFLFFEFDLHFCFSKYWIILLDVITDYRFNFRFLFQKYFRTFFQGE